MKWTDKLDDEVYNRLGNCRSRKSDIEPLVDAKWSWMKETGKDDRGLTKEDALVSVLELLESNSCTFDLSLDEYNSLCAE